jgi:glucuronoarabinoxylan endo-1,4-beta-xylanase
MKKLIFVVCIMSLGSVLTNAVPAFGAELVTNPGFENGTAPWAPRGDGSCTLTVTTAQKHSGSYSGLATNRTATWNGIKQSMLGKMTNGNSYTISAWLRASRRSTGTVSIERTDDRGTSYFTVASGSITNSGWTKLTGDFTVDIVGTCTTLDVYFEGPNAGIDLYADDASVVVLGDPNLEDPVAPPPPLPTVNATGSVAPSTRYQILDGFGASGGWYEGQLLNHSKRDLLYDLMFDKLGLDIYRIRNSYGYDTAYLDNTEQIVAAARAEKPNIKIMASAWSPPPYLKSNNSIVGGTLKKNASGAFMYNEYGQWWADSVADLASRGMNPEYVSMQNEPDFVASYDSCKFSASEPKNKSTAGYDQAFRAVYARLTTPKLLMPETTGTDLGGSYISKLTAADKTHLYAYAFHLYTNGSGGAFDTGFDEAHPDKPSMMTEYSTDYATYTNCMNLAKLMHTGLTEASITAYMYWDLFWGDAGGLITLLPVTFEVNPVYWAFKQYSAFTDTGWQRVNASTNNSSVKIVAFIKPDNHQLTIVMINTSTANNISLDLSNLGFNVSSGTVYRTSEVERCVTVGDFATPLLLYGNSITTVVLNGSL